MPQSCTSVPGGRRLRPRNRSLSLVAVTTVLAALAVIMPGTPASAAAPTRADSKSRPVVLVHGLNKDGTNCTDDWANAIAVLQEEGFSGPFVTFGYYQDNVANSCTRNYGGSTDTSLDTVARVFANWVHDTYTTRDTVIDVVAHSMGGLIVRRAIAGVQNKVPGFPSTIYIEDVVTLATPHGGAPDAIWCTANTQCAQIRPGSDFLEGLARNAGNPQSSIGTDWSVVASESDPWVSTSSATKMDAGHQYVYLKSNRLDHSEVRTHHSTARTFDIRWKHVEGARSGTDHNGAATLRVTAAALYRWRSW